MLLAQSLLSMCVLNERGTPLVELSDARRSLAADCISDWMNHSNRGDQNRGKRLKDLQQEIENSEAKAVAVLPE
jgi:hypothetical protein